jgi:aminopeptidase-like protein
MTRCTTILEELDHPGIGHDLFSLVADIFPICRSLTGAGVRTTLRHLQSIVDLQIREVASGTPAFDWVVPKEWNIRDAFIKSTDGTRVLDFGASNLHVVHYSTPIHGHFSLQELKKHIFSLPDQPDLIPYRTSYYDDSWGFCMAHRQLERLEDRTYEVLIDSTLADGNLSYGEYLHRGETEQEVLFSTHVCHPSMANDNCSGIALLAYFAARLARLRTRYSYRFLFAPGTIGAIIWLSRNEDAVRRVAHGLVVSCVGDQGGPSYKKSRRGDAAIDRVMSHVLHHASPAAEVVEFSPYGYDERQYCSPAFDLPVGSFQRSRPGTFPEYHTSGDDLALVRPEHLAASYQVLASAVDVLESDVHMENLSPKCEPQLGRRGLYSAIGGGKDGAGQALALLWVLNLSDRKHSLLDIAVRSGMPFRAIRKAALVLHDAGLVRYVGPNEFAAGG